VSRGRAVSTAVLACALLGAVLGAPRTVSAAGPIPTAYHGWDISWPQCTAESSTRTPPASSQFAVVGVSGGRSFTVNPCDSAQFAWASGQAAPPTLYMVLDAPHQGGVAADNGMSGPAGNCAAPPSDMACNDYNYGVNNAKFEYAKAGASGLSSQVWWLDIETGNCWNYTCNGYDTTNNWRVIQGNIDYLHSVGVTAGIYSTGYQFGLIAGSSYRPGVPLWLADYDGGDPSQDCGLSAKAFAGGQVWQVQSAPVKLSDGNTYDPDYSCPSPHGYWLVASDGGIFPFGTAMDHSYGSTGGTRLNQPIVGMARTASGNGYWLVAADGGIFPFGDAVYHSYGSTGNVRLNKPIVGMAATPSGNGYWLVASDGGIFPFGDAVYHSYGSTGNVRLNQPIVGMAPTADGNGYWLVAADGGIFPFGEAVYHSYGSTGNIRLNQPIVGMAPTPTGNGYWLVAADGGIFPFGDAVYRSYGSAGGMHLSSPVIGMAVTPDGLGYWMATKAGQVLCFGDALYYGSMAGKPLAQPIVGLAATP
jgi:hypothetical protein